MKRTLLSLGILLFALSASADVDVDREALRGYALKLINRDRVRLHLPKLKLDPKLSAFAGDQAARLLAGKPEPLTPYMRYSFAGGNDMLRENVHSWTVSYELTDDVLQGLLRKTHEAMMAEEPPLDGRRGTLLDAQATHAGIGFAIDHGRFFIVEEVVRRHVAWTQPVPRKATTADKIPIAGAPLPGVVFDSITVHHELPPAEPVSRETFPPNPKDYLPRLGSEVKRDDSGSVAYIQHLYGEGRRGEVAVAKDGSFSVNIPFTEGAGIYTIVVWVHYPGLFTPFPAGSVSIRVEESPAATVLPVR
jgi:hypothetical protein